MQMSLDRCAGIAVAVFTVLQLVRNQRVIASLVSTASIH